MRKYAIEPKSNISQVEYESMLKIDGVVIGELSGDRWLVKWSGKTPQKLLDLSSVEKTFNDIKNERTV